MMAVATLSAASACAYSSSRALRKLTRTFFPLSTLLWCAWCDSAGAPGLLLFSEAVPSAGRSHRGLLAVAGLCSLFAGRSMPRHRHPWPAHIQPPHAAPVAPLDACRLLSSDVEAAALRSTDGGGAGGEHMPTRSNGEGVCGRCCAARSFVVSLMYVTINQLRTALYVWLLAFTVALLRIPPIVPKG